MPMEEVHLEPEEIDYLLGFRPVIDAQLDEIELDFFNQDKTAFSHKMAELCMYHFSLGRVFEKEHSTK